MDHYRYYEFQTNKAIRFLARQGGLSFLTEENDVNHYIEITGNAISRNGKINGLSGAILSNIAIFLPSFILVVLLNPMMKKIRRYKSLSAFPEAVNVASVAIIVAVCYTMGKETVTDWRTIIIGLISAFVVVKYQKINIAFIVLGGALLGYIINTI